MTEVATTDPAGQDQERVATPAGVEVSAAAVATSEQLVAILRRACIDVPMEAEPGDFLRALDRQADAEAAP